MTRLDWFAVAVVGIAALLGFKKGLIGSALSTAGIVAGAIIGGRVAPHLLGGEDSPYAPLIALGGAALGALLLETVGTLVGNSVRRAISLSPLRAVDSAGGLVIGALAGLAIVWVLGAVFLHLPSQTQLRESAQRSAVLQRLNDVVPPTRLIQALERVDPFPTIAGPSAPVEPPDPGVLRHPVVRRAAPSVVRVVGTACGLAVSGSGWVIAPGLVVTAAHVVAGQDDTHVQPTGGGSLDAHAVVYDPRNDLAVLRVDGLRAPALRLADADSGEPVVLLGFPEGGGFRATPGRIGRTATVLSEDAYGNGPVTRTIVSVRGRVRHGNSGGPAVATDGSVQATIFAARVGADSGYGVPAGVVRRDLANAGGEVSTGDCAR
jgi:S1-C subfamily serine protease